MSDSNPAVPGAKERPSTVTISSYLLYAVAAIQVISSVAGLSVLTVFDEVYTDAYGGTEYEAVATFTTITLVATAVLGLLVAAGLVILALLNNRGKNPARIVTWVLGGIFLCCSGIGLIGGLAGNAMTGGASSTDPDLPDPTEVQAELEAALPGWFNPVNTVLGVIGLLALLAALILLALPPSNEFFRKPTAQWEPPVPGGGYPAAPPMPGGAYPGYPPPPGAPGSQPPDVPPPGAPGSQPPNPPPAG
ncbi:hypothetical protein ACN27F_18470 [Solwaraspora sp. WMMB335]|uniref:hypothetical protein n=1 Tax=Solwaraspora sp. WMMB335 TaxID=3404118 RepID=UPI003B94C795